MTHLPIVFSNESKFLIDLSKLNLLGDQKGLNPISGNTFSLKWIKTNFSWEEVESVSTLVPDPTFNYEFDFKHSVVTA